MADFVAVLRKTIGTLGDNTPEMREKVYDKARATIEAKLAAIEPPPPGPVVDRQRKALEDAIAVVRADYADQADPENDEDLEDVFATLKSMGDVKTSPLPRAGASPRVAPDTVLTDVSASSPALSPASPPADISSAGDPAAEQSDDDVVAPRAEAAAASAPHRRARPGPRRRTMIVATLALLLVFAGGGYAVWLNKDDLFGGDGPVVAATTPGAAVAEQDAATTAEELTEAEPAEEVAVPAEEAEQVEEAATPAEAETEQEAAAPEPTEPAEQPVATEDPEPAEEDVAALPTDEEPTTPAAAASGETKFTQRLLPDGSEVDEGPAGGPRSVGEGTSVAAVAQPQEEPGATDDASPEATSSEQEDASAAAVAVGQRAIFYEERTSSAQGSAELGSIVWSIVQEPPGGDLPPEPAIRAEATIPGKDVQLRMTIRRNGDQTLPASHIVEMIFLTPDGFEEGAIANVSRISFKETEQAPGNPLMGIPAKIADGFFLIALGDTPAERETNTTLLGRRSWVDIPIVYQTGRRALLSLEKGIPGERVFEEALRAWSQASSG